MSPLEAWRARIDELLDQVQARDLPEVVGELARAQAVAMARLAAPAQPPAGELLTPQEVAKRLKVAPSHVYDKVRKKELRSVRSGKYVRVPAEALEEYLRRQERGGYTTA